MKEVINTLAYRVIKYMIGVAFAAFIAWVATLVAIPAPIRAALIIALLQTKKIIVKEVKERFK